MSIWDRSQLRHYPKWMETTMTTMVNRRTRTNDRVWSRGRDINNDHYCSTYRSNVLYIYCCFSLCGMHATLSSTYYIHTAAFHYVKCMHASIVELYVSFFNYIDKIHTTYMIVGTVICNIIIIIMRWQNLLVKTFFWERRDIDDY